MKKKKTTSKTQQKEKPNLAIRYTGIAGKMAVIILIGVYGGIKLDEYFNTEFPGWTLTLSLVSVFLAMYQIIKDS